MHGKRPFRRKKTPDSRYPAQPLGLGPRKELRRAHRLMESGEHANAVPLFERLARTAYDMHMLRPAPHLFLQAARARLLSGEREAGRDLLLQGLSILAEAGRWETLQNAGILLEEELPALGQEQVGAEIRAWIDDQLKGQKTAQDVDTAPARRAGLPLTCPYCQAALHPIVVEWFDRTAAECPYCGSVIQIEK